MSEEYDADGQLAQPRTITELLERCNDAWAELQRQVEGVRVGGGVDAAQLTTPGPDGWTVKDHLAHISAWEKSMLAILGGQNPFTPLGVRTAQPASREVDRLNEIVYETNRDRNLDDVLTDFRRTHEEAMTALARLSTADLHKPYAHYQPDDPRNRQEPVIQFIAGDTYEHYEDHIPWIRTMLGQM